MDIIIHLTEEQKEKLAYIQQYSHQDIAILLNQAIEQQYEKLQRLNPDPLRVLKESGFIGCGIGETNLSTNYKAILKEEWSKNDDYC